MKYIKIIIAGAILLGIIAIIFWLRSATKDNYIELGSSEAIEPTPTQIQSIKDIGEWEFLSVSAEEMADTLRKGFFSNDELVRIYYGTLRLGVNLHQASPRWLQASGDSVTVTLPRIGLLDRDFIDEARTKSFYETGRWSPADREKLYHKAYRQMVAHSLTKENMETARQNAEEQFRQMMKAMGFRYIDIKFEEE